MSGAASSVTCWRQSLRHPPCMARKIHARISGSPSAVGARLSARSSFSCFRLVVVTIAGLRSSR